MPIPVQRETWWRMPDSRPPMGTVRRPKGLVRLFLPYWAGALALAWGIHLDLVPVRHWLVALAPPAAAEPAAPGPTPGPAPRPPAREPQPALEPPVVAPPLAAEQAPEHEVAIDEIVDEAPAEPSPRAVAAAAESNEAAASEASEAEAMEVAVAEDLSHLWADEDPVLTRPGSRRAEASETKAYASDISSLIDPSRRERSDASAPAPRKSRKIRRSGGSSAGTSCEGAIAAYREQVRMGDDSVPADISAARYGAVLNRGSYFRHCGVPESTAVHICAAVQNGRAVGVTVTTTPRSGKLERCVAAAVRGLGFPSHPRMDVTRTTFE